MLKAIGYLSLLCGAFIALLITMSIVGLRSGAAPADAPSAADTITLSEWSVRVQAQTKPGTYTFTIVNHGQNTHELLVFRSDLAVAAYPTDKGDIIEDGPGITINSDGENLASGDSQQRTVDLSQPGKYLFVCNLPGHFKNGMYTEVTVTP